MSGGGAPEDHSVQLETMKEAERASAQQTADTKAAAETKRLSGLRSQAISGARSSANSYFTGRGLVGKDYTSFIEDLINQVASSIASNDSNPGSYFSNIGERAYGSAESAGRNAATRDIDRLLPSDFESRRISDTADDPILAAIDAEQRSTADQYVQNLLSRGVITNSGYTAAESALNTQENSVKAKLAELGAGALETGRGDLRTIANTGRTAASTLNLGTNFNASNYASDVDKKFTDFMANLGQTIRGKVSGNLFDTSGLPVIAGAAQGAGNYAYDPKAVAGLIGNTTDEEDQNRTAQSSTGIF